MISPRAFILLIGALLVPFFKGRARKWFVILLPAAAFYLVTKLAVGSPGRFIFLASI